ncbi:peptidase T [Ligilactobacillus equi]|uniref:peptidase T n=1 Tax=Ligilactobacillus equi TaxID=137357 RepID=UPI002ED15D44
MTNFLQDKFIEYAKCNSRSDFASHELTPSTPGQKELALKLVADMQALGLKAYYNEKSGFAIGYLPSNTEQEISAIGFIAHLDTADFAAENVQPQVHPNYNGQDIILNVEKKIVLSVTEFPEVKKLKGQTLITSDGTTLLGTDDKAGVVAALGAAKYFLEHPEIEHGDLYLGFGPDEEIGIGAQRFDPHDFPVEFAYTLDNGQPGELQYETFNASEAILDIEGTSVHPGNAYHLLVNAGLLAQEFIARLPKDEVPEKTKDHQGFILVHSYQATVDHAQVKMIVRDFDHDKWRQKEQLLQALVAEFNTNLDKPRFKLHLREQYRNIADEIVKNPYIVNLALDAYRKVGLTPNVQPFRGGTDGNFITQKGIPAPNLFNGGGNYHGQYEYVTVEQLEILQKVITTIVTEHLAQKDQRNNQPLK